NRPCRAETGIHNRRSRMVRFLPANDGTYASTACRHQGGRAMRFATDRSLLSRSHISLALIAVTFGSPRQLPAQPCADARPFPNPAFPVTGYPFAVAVGDLNGDGIADLATANSSSNYASILLGNGDDTYQPEIQLQVGSSQYA